MKTFDRWPPRATLASTMVLCFVTGGRAVEASYGVHSATAASSISGDVIVEKTVYSSRLRLVFVLGLEGSGHHLIMGATARLFEEHPEVPRVDENLLEFSNYYLPSAMGYSVTAYENAQTDARTQMRDFAQRLEHVQDNGTFHLFNGHSFPTGHGVQKVMQYPDLRLVAEVAEAAGVDLRVLYMKRSAKEILLADTIHRHFENYLSNPEDPPMKRFMEFTRVLLTDTAVVHSFLAELDPAFVMCHDWDLLGDPEQAQKIGDFVAPRNELAELVRDALVDSSSGGAKHPGEEMHPFDEAGVISSRIQHKMASFEGLYCNR